MPAGKKRLTSSERRDLVRGLLENNDISALVALALEDHRLVRIVYSRILEPDDIIRWRAIETLGLVVSSKSRADTVYARDLLRRLIWSMNDESGNVPWHAPEAIGEIMANVTSLIREFGPMLFTFLREEPFERGAHWALARVLWVERDHLCEHADRLVPSLEDPDPFIRAHAALGLGACTSGESSEKIRTLRSDRSSVTIYDSRSGLMKQVTVGDIAEVLIGSSPDAPDRSRHLYTGVAAGS